MAQNGALHFMHIYLIFPGLALFFSFFFYKCLISQKLREMFKAVVRQVKIRE